jgi:hypothetical protein
MLLNDLKSTETWLWSPSLVVLRRIVRILTVTVTRSHKFNERDHAGIADGTAEREARLPKYFAKSGHSDSDPTKTKKGM